MRCLRFSLRSLLHIPWLPLLPLVLGLLPGGEAAAVLASLSRRGSLPEGRAALAMALELRHLVPLAGAAWAAACLGPAFDGGVPSLMLRRGHGRGEVCASLLLPWALGCLLLSAAAQAASALPLRIGALPLLWRLRRGCLRLLLDLGMGAPAAALVCLFRENLYGRALAFAWGVTLWRVMGSHYGLWLPEAGEAGLAALWPLGALPLGVLFCCLAICRAEF